MSNYTVFTHLLVVCGNSAVIHRSTGHVSPGGQLRRLHHCGGVPVSAEPGLGREENGPIGLQSVHGRPHRTRPGALLARRH